MPAIPADSSKIPISLNTTLKEALPLMALISVPIIPKRKAIIPTLRNGDIVPSFDTKKSALKASFNLPPESTASNMSVGLTPLININNLKNILIIENINPNTVKIILLIPEFF